jgi:hypothetical protein
MWSRQTLKLASRAAIAAGLSGCATEAPPQPLDVRLIGEVVAKIKHQVGIYQSKVQSERDKNTLVPRDPGDPAPLCGDGLVDFNITSVTAALTTKVEINTKGSASISAPLATGIMGGPSGGGGKDATNSQVLTFIEYPVYPVKFPYNPDTDKLDDPHNVVAAALYSYRTALRQSAYFYPCFSTLKDPSKDKENTLVVDVSAVLDQDIGGALNVEFLKLAFDHDQKSTSDHKITFGFRPYDPSHPNEATVLPDKRPTSPANKEPIPAVHAANRSVVVVPRNLKDFEAVEILRRDNAIFPAPKEPADTGPEVARVPDPMM